MLYHATDHSFNPLFMDLACRMILKTLPAGDNDDPIFKFEYLSSK